MFSSRRNNGNKGKGQKGNKQKPNSQTDATPTTPNTAGGTGEPNGNGSNETKRPDLPLNEEKKINKAINTKLELYEQKENRTIGLLLLGAGGSGKSTVLKQMEKIYKGHIAQNALNDAVHYIRQVCATVFAKSHNIVYENENMMRCLI